jgi:hypothetical protein
MPWKGQPGDSPLGMAVPHLDGLLLPFGSVLGGCLDGWIKSCLIQGQVCRHVAAGGHCLYPLPVGSESEIMPSHAQFHANASV